MSSREQAVPLFATGKLLPLGNEHWRQIATAINPDPNIAERTNLPNGQSLREGFQVAISDAVESAAQPTGGTIRAEVRHFARTIMKGYSRMSPLARELWRNPVDGWMGFLPDMADAVTRMETSLSSTKDGKPIGLFLADVVWLVSQCPSVAQTLPGKNDIHRAKMHALFRAARAALTVALALAERHDPAAVPVLRRTNKLKASVFVEHLRKARREPSVHSMSLSDW
jgi:hypothetical protein